MSDLSRVEDILQATIDGTPYDPAPQSRVEALLIDLKEVIEEGGSGSSSLAGLSDVDTSSAADGKVLKYNGTTEKWEADIDEGKSTLAGLTDVNIASLSNKQMLQYDSASNKWKNVTPEKLKNDINCFWDSSNSMYVIQGYPRYYNFVYDYIRKNDSAYPYLFLTSDSQGHNIENRYMYVGCAQAQNESEPSAVYFVRFYSDVDDSNPYNLKYYDYAEFAAVKSNTKSSPGWLHNCAYVEFHTANLTPVPYVKAADNGKVLTVVSGEWRASTLSKELPSVTSSDNGKILGVSNGSWDKVDAPTELPEVNSSDNGKSLVVVNGVWDKANIYTELTGTLTAGQTSITIQNAIITANSTIDSIYVDIKGVKYIDMTIATGSVTLKFPAQNQDMGVKVRVS